MRKIFLCLILFASCCQLTLAQKNEVDSLTRAYQKNRQDTTLVRLLVYKAGAVFLYSNPDSCISCLNKGLAISRKIHYKVGEVRARLMMASYLRRRGDLPQSFKIIFDLLPGAIAINDQWSIAWCYNSLGNSYAVLKDYKKGLSYYFLAKAIADKAHLTDLLPSFNGNIADRYLDLGMIDSAEYYTEKANNIDKNGRDSGYTNRGFGAIQVLRKNYAKGIDYFRKSISIASQLEDHQLLSSDYRGLAEAYTALSRNDSCFYFAKKAFDEATRNKDPSMVMESTMLLADQYRIRNDFKSAFKYQQIMLKAQDSLFNQRKALQIQTLVLNQEQQKREEEAAQESYQNKVQRYTLLGVIGVFMLIAFFLIYANGQRKKANKALEQRKEKIENQHKSLEKTYAELKATQTQLIQSEKMASLGELTAGIAHEIQNPLNFVNNFSDVNREMLTELQRELDKGDVAEAKAIAADIEQNEQKINHHGKRAEAIVKGMLEHSRSSTGQKEPTDINQLAEEYIRLSYHGLRAKDKSFNAELITNFDLTIPKVNAIPQDIGRVLLNLFNNAFYAVNQKAKTAGVDYKPEVSVTTTTESGQVIIKVKDNGIGIPDAIKEKIMQPFFTTKPTGEGTGLGLSLTYDMVVKGHGGKITVNSVEGEGSEFIVTLLV